MGFKLVVLLRLSPIIPFNVVNYFIGTTTISLKSNIMSFVGIIPDSAIYVLVGC